MQTNIWSCLICEREFHPIFNIPRILYTCGHTFCSQCLQAILNFAKSCPFDFITTPLNLQVEQLPINTTILAALPTFSTCTKHKKPQDLLCLKEFQKICIDCKKKCLEKRHKIRNLRDVEAEADEKKRILWNIADEFDSEYGETVTLLNEKDEAILKEVDSNFEFFQAEIEKTKNHVHSAVKRYFEEQRKLANESYNRDFKLLNNANDLYQILRQKTYDQNYLDAIHTQIGSLAICSQKPRIDAAINVLENHVEAIRIEIMALLGRIPTLLKAKNELNDVVLLNGFDLIEEEIVPSIEIEDSPKAMSFFYGEIEENDRLILSFKNHQIETENILNDDDDLEKLKTINAVTLNINKSRLWKEAIENLQYIWNKFDNVLDFKIDFSFKTYAKETLEALLQQSHIWATSDLLKFKIDLSAASQVEDKQVIQLYEKAISEMINVEKLEIVLKHTKITDKSVKTFTSSTLPYLTSLTDFHFYINSTKVSDDSMEKLLLGLHNRKRNLTSFAFGFDDTAITDKTIENIAQNISPLAVGLRKFDISAENTKVSDESLKMLLENFDLHFSKLKEFTLDLGWTKVSNEGFKDFADNMLPKMTSLENFELFLNNQRQITDQIMISIAKKLDWKIKKICLELGGTKITGKTLAALEQFALKNKPMLETLELYIAETKIKDADMNDFYMKINEEQTFQNLKKISFCFSQIDTTDETCESLAKVIQSCNLEILHLQLDYTKITDLGLISLSDGLNQTKITELQLYLDGTGVTDKGLKVFSQKVVRNLLEVKSFELSLASLQGVTENGVEVLLTDLSTVAGSLRKIDLDLSETRITDDSMKVLNEKLWKEKPKLESFILSIGGNKEITDKGLKLFLQNFAPILDNLKGLVLNVEKTRISKEGLWLLKQYLQKVPNALDTVEIEVGNDQDLKRIVHDLENHLV